MKGHRFLREALVEYGDCLEFYERAQTGLGEKFIREVDRVIALATEFPDMGSLVSDTPPELGIRRQIVLRFGVEVDYVVAADYVVVLAVFHGRRQPGYWHDRLDSLRSSEPEP